MIISVGPVSSFVEHHPTVKMLALSFLLLIGMTLIGEGFEVHIPKGLYLFCDGLLGAGGDAEPEDTAQESPGSSARAAPLIPFDRRTPLMVSVSGELCGAKNNAA